MGTDIETPSGKTAADENFPVGSWLLPAALRPHVAAYYRFARAADDIGDNPDLAPGDKIARLVAFGHALKTGQGDAHSFATAFRLRASLEATGVPQKHALDLLEAFKQDATKRRYANWDELMQYCAVSAAPVGRFLMDLHGEDVDGYSASDALCSALQVLNHLQDCQADHRLLDRVYLPQDWMADAGVTVNDLQRASAVPGLRQVLDQCLDQVDKLLGVAAALPGPLRSRRLAMESAVILRLARRLSRLLRRRDPIACRVALSKTDFLVCGLAGMVQGWFGAAVPRSTATAHPA